jgi:Zn-dependent M28 family amino/carboxypeptidase
MTRTTSRRARAVALGAVGAMALTGTVALAGPAVAAPGGCETRNNDTLDKLLECVGVEGVDEHLKALQQIATDNGGTRASGTPGYTASADYLQQRLEAAGYEVTRQPFSFDFFELTSETLSRTGPEAKDYAAGTDFATLEYSGVGTASGPVVPVDLGNPLAPTDTSTSGCEEGDFAGFPAGGVALVQRGTCTFGVKVANAKTAGAVGVVVVNRGTPENEGPVAGTLGAPGPLPAIGVSFAAGQELAAPNTTVTFTVAAETGTRDTENDLAERPGRTDQVVQLGAHLDSVPEGPGINDNGSGSAAILEVAENMQKVRPERTVRFSWWGAEESGLLGSTRYVQDLIAQSPAELDRITAYLNFDMVGSPNYVRFVYDGDNTLGTAPEGYVTPESAALEAMFESFYDGRGLAYADTEFDGRSDYKAFADNGVPSGGLFTGAEKVKTPEQAALFGGTAGEPYDRCYHQACDDISNLNAEVLDQNADAIAYAVFTLAAGGPGAGN